MGYICWNGFNFRTIFKWCFGRFKGSWNGIKIILWTTDKIYKQINEYFYNNKKHWYLQFLTQIHFSAAFSLMSSRFAQPSTIAPSAINRSRSIRRSDPSHPLLPVAREVCRSCFENPHMDFGNRVLSRVYEKRPDFQKFVLSVGKEKWPLMTNNFQNFIEEIVNNVSFLI